MVSRYEVVGTEGECEPGSDGLVLANKHGITSPEDINELEMRLLYDLYAALLFDQLPIRQLKVEDLKKWHRQWLGNVYEWAGQERSVNMSKGGFPFAAAGNLGKLLSVFEGEVLARHTPCKGMTEDELVAAVAETHVEFILIHPFREGNGRLSRLLADVMSAQAGFGTLDYSEWDHRKEAYIEAIHQGMSLDYAPMESFVRQALDISQ